MYLSVYIPVIYRSHTADNFANRDRNELELGPIPLVHRQFDLSQLDT